MPDEPPLPFWFDDGGAVVAGASREEIAEAEKLIGRSLPPKFRELLLEQDGGVSNYAFWETNVYVGLPAFFSVSQIVGAIESAALFGTPRGVIAIGSGGHCWLGLDYRSGDAASVVYQDTEDADIETIAGSFEALLAELVVEE